MISQDCCGGLRAGEKSPARFAFEGLPDIGAALAGPILVLLF
ncbi:hypothetical protein [Ensifer canadensis]|nr:hypothetical protein [Ensifer canadensis]